MRKKFLLTMVVLVSFYFIVWAKSAGFQKIKATDGTFTVQIPTGWRVASATIETFLAANASAENVYLITKEIPSDQESAKFIFSGLQTINPMSASQTQAFFRAVSPPLQPVEVISELLPKLDPDRIRNMRILESKDLPLQTAESGRAWVHFQYLLNRDGRSIPMEGIAEVTTTPDLMRKWSFTLQGSEAPPQIFHKHLSLYRKIFKSFHLDLAAYERLLNGQVGLINQVGETYNQAGKDLMKQMKNGQEEFDKTLRDCCNNIHEKSRKWSNSKNDPLD